MNNSSFINGMAILLMAATPCAIKSISLMIMPAVKIFIPTNVLEFSKICFSQPNPPASILAPDKLAGQREVPHRSHDNPG